MKDETKEYDPRRRREIIKTILIVFLAALLILTFCSNSIMNRSLPEVSTERVSSGKLTERVRGSGILSSNQSYDVMVDENKTVDTIMVKVGKEVRVVHGPFAGITGRLVRKRNEYYFIKTMMEVGVMLRISRWYCEPVPEKSS